MHTVVETPAFLSAAKAAAMSDQTRAEIVATLAANPKLGELMEGTGGLRKFRFSKPGMGKSGGYRVCSYFHSQDYPVFLITVFGKNVKANLSRTERNQIAAFLKGLATKYPAKGKAE